MSAPGAARKGRGQVLAPTCPETPTGSDGQAPSHPFAIVATPTKAPAPESSRATRGQTARPPARRPATPKGGQGGGNGGQGLRRQARTDTCPTCGQTILAGLDADLMAGTATVTPTPLTPAQEATEWAAGRRTYMWTAPHRELDFRDRWRITGHPADTATVYPTHTCPTTTLF